MAFSRKPYDPQDPDESTQIEGGAPIRFLPLDHVYSATSPTCNGSSNVMSKKVKARKLVVNNFNDQEQKTQPNHAEKPPIYHVYSRRRLKRKQNPSQSPSFFDSLLAREKASSGVTVKLENFEDEDLAIGALLSKKKRRKVGGSELEKLKVDSVVLNSIEGSRLRDCNNTNTGNLNDSGNSNCGSSQRKKPSEQQKLEDVFSGSAAAKKWVGLNCNGIDPKTFIGLRCKVYWPLDADWYTGHIVGYNFDTNRHNIEYVDGDKEDLIISNERIKFFVSKEEMQSLNLNFSTKNLAGEVYDYNEMVVLAASLDDCQDLEPGDIIWAKLTGHAMWPAIVVDESIIRDRKGLNNISGRSVPVQFFGTHDFARIKVKQVISFLRGLLSSFHLKSRKPQFVRSLEEAKMYLSEHKLPKRMMQLQNGIDVNDCESASGEDGGTIDSDGDCVKDVRIKGTLESLGTSPYVIGDLQIISLGQIVIDSEYFQDERFICPEGYTALRRFTSIKDPSAFSMYKMEVLRNAECKSRPLFRVTVDNREQFKGSTPSACWNQIYKKLRKIQQDTRAGCNAQGELRMVDKSGTEMFGFSNPEVVKLVKGLSKSSLHAIHKLASRRYRELPVGYRPVRVDWKDLDKCSVCHMDEEYENNLFLQCDKCRIMVHARCYGELEPVDGVLWLCNLCRQGAPDSTPPCALCPVIGGAMKPTTCGRWAHLACAIWIPETCLSDVKRMEPIDGLGRIHKDRWKLLCSICGVSYGACIQCSNNSCRVAYHPLCARAAGLCLELEDEDRLILLSLDDDDDEDHCIRLLSFCKRHKQPSNERTAHDGCNERVARQCSEYNPPPNPSGCARSEPYNNFGRRGRKEPEVLAASSSKRLFVENQPYIVGGYSQHDSIGNMLSHNGVTGSKHFLSLQRLKASQLDAPNNIQCMSEKYNYMRETFRKRLAFGKSGIHGFGIFSKQPHRAGDMVIEYTGELVRPPIADRREHLIYNSLVGAGTYMFRIDNERVIDATRAGSIAHLINHSCEPNCYSRVISVNGEEHIIIFAKRDIKRWEELTYDYRFFSIDEQLACYCGFPRCRGVVNDTEAEEQVAKLYAPRSELTEWRE